MTLKPCFVLWTAILRQLPLQLFLTLWSGLFFGGLFSFFRVAVAAAAAPHTDISDLARVLLSGPAAVGTIVFLAVPIVTVGLKALNYRNTRYMIDDRHVVVEEGFWTVQGKRLLLEDVREVTLRRSVLQRLSGVGSVYLASRVQGGGWSWRGSAMLGATSLFGSGVMLMDLADWRAVYDDMQRRLGERRA